MSDTSGLSSDQAENMKEVDEKIRAASQKFEESMKTASPSDMVEAVGKYISDLAEPVKEFGDGLGDTLEDSAGKAFGSEEFGTGLVSETGEAFFGIVGEVTEGITEMATGLGAAAMELTGGVIENVGSAGGELWDAGGSLMDGDVGGAVDHVFEAGKDVVDIAKAGLDTVGAVVHAAGEGVEMVGETVWAAGEGAVEMTVGLANNVADAAGYVADGVSDAAGYVADGVSDAADYVADGVSDVAESAYDEVSDAASYVVDGVADWFE